MNSESISSAQGALQRDFQRLERSASRISRGEPGVDYAAEALEQILLRRDAQAQSAVLRSADEMLGLIIDLKA